MIKLTSHNVGKLAAPIPAAIFLGWEIYTAAIAYSIPPALAILGAVCLAVAIEAVGMSAGHNAIVITSAGHWLAAPSWLTLITYTAVGMYELWGTIFAIAFLYSFLSYLNAGVNAVWEMSRSAKNGNNADRRAAQEREIAAQERQIAAQDLAQKDAATRENALSLARLDAQREVQLAKIAAQIHVSAPTGMPLRIAANSPQRTPKNRLTEAQRSAIAGMDTDTIARVYHVSARTAQMWKVDFAPSPATRERTGLSAD